jgi:hypothetical protein
MEGLLGRCPSAVACCTLILAVAPAVSDTTVPGEVPGLVAWYEVHSLHRHKRDGDTVDRWTDSSRRGHDLDATSDGAPPRFRTLQLNGKPVVAIGRADHFDVASPFELEDHTIFLVYGTDNTRRAFFRSDSDASHGVILGQDGRSHQYQNGKEGLFPYNRPMPLDQDNSITVLGRESGVLRAFVNGVDISSDAELTKTIRVGRFFHLEHTTFVGSDGEGLRIAEMIFYDRFLTDAERAGITRYLSEEYGIALESGVVARTVAQTGDDVAIDEAAVLVRLGIDTEINVNDDLVAIGWNIADKVAPPFRFDTEDTNTELHCARDGTRVRVTLTLPLRSDVVEARVRALLLKNGRDYHPKEAVNGPFEGPGPDRKATIRFQTVMTLDAGDFVEAVTSRAGPSGQVRLEPGGALFIVERIE